MGRADDSGRKEMPVTGDEDEGFLPRWSRRKLGERDAQLVLGDQSLLDE